MKGIGLIVVMKEMDNIIMKIVNIQNNEKTVKDMIKVYYIIKMELFVMKVIGQMIILKDMGKDIFKMLIQPLWVKLKMAH